jgi:hypothetical protein
MTHCVLHGMQLTNGWQLLWHTHSSRV